jgi:hypothetical protein
MREAVAGLLGLVIAALLAVIVYQNQRRFHTPLITTLYQAVTLANGSVIYGRLDHLGTDYPVLRDAFEVRREIDPQTRQPHYLVVKRSDEANGADHVILPATAIAFIEPVRPDSPVGKLIGQAGIR